VFGKGFEEAKRVRGSKVAVREVSSVEYLFSAVDDFSKNFQLQKK